MKKRVFTAFVVLFILFAAGGIFLWSRASSGEQFLNYPNDIPPSRICIGDMQKGEMWEVVDPDERLALMKNWNRLRVKETGKFAGDISEEVLNYRFNVVVELSPYIPVYEVFFLDSPKESSNNQVEYETVYGDNNFAYIEKMIENSPKDAEYDPAQKRIENESQGINSEEEDSEDVKWIYLETDGDGNAYEYFLGG